MNKDGLEALEELAKEHYHILKGVNEKEFYIFESDEYEIIKKELKVLKIITTKIADKEFIRMILPRCELSDEEMELMKGYVYEADSD